VSGTTECLPWGGVRNTGEARKRCALTVDQEEQGVDRPDDESDRRIQDTEIEWLEWDEENRYTMMAR